MPMWAKKQELVTEEDKESSSKKEVMYDVVEEPAMKVLRSLLQVWEHSSSQNDSPPREPETADRYPVRAMRQCLRQAAEAGYLDVLSAFPIIVKGQRNVHEPLPFSLYKDLKRSIRENGLKSPYTNGLFQAITDSYRMAPCDWIASARTVLTPAQFTESGIQSTLLEPPTQQPKMHK